MDHTRSVGLSIDFHLPYKHHAGIFSGVQRYADERGWLTTFDDWIADTLARSPRGKPAYDGVIARVTADHADLISKTTSLGIPLVNVFAASPAFDQLPGVFPDLEEVGRMRAEHLTSRGLQNFAMIFSKDRIVDQRQAAAFAATVAAAGHSVTSLTISDNWGDSLPRYRKNQDRIQAWMNGWELPIGLGTASDSIARLMAQLIHGRGWRVPEDVAIVGCLNDEQLCESPRPTLTSIELGYDRIGYEAAKLLERLMDEAGAARKLGKKPLLGRRSEKPPSPACHVVLPPVGMVVRESTDFYAARDEVVAQSQAFIAANCHRPIGVMDVAEKASVSIRTLQDRFSKVLGRKVTEEIRRVRIEKAKRELAWSERSIHEIAVRTGFSSNGRLAEAFRRNVGVSPSEYRTKHRKKRDT